MSLQINPADFTNLALEAHDDGVWVVTLNRPTKRNALDIDTIEELVTFFSAAPRAGVRAVVLAGAGDHFCAGLDLIEHHDEDRSPADFMHVCLRWHEAFNKMEYGGVPIIAALQGAVVGGGLELASATHVRIAEASTIFQLPEGRRGIFVGGGATARVGRLLGPDRMTEMMLTGRKYNAAEGLALGLTHYAVGEGEALALAQQLAGKIARNAPLSNYLMIQSIARINDMSKSDGLFTESLAAALSQTTPDAEEGLKAFLEKRAPKFR